MSAGINRLIRKTVSKIDISLSSKIMYRVFVRKKLNLKDPKSFNEKICWLKLNVFPNDPTVIECADKCKVHDYLTKQGMGQYVVPLLGVWESCDDIDFDSLPDKFVLKCNHGCAYNIICTDKSTFDIENAKKKLSRWMKEDFGLVSGEPHYSKIPRKIICEEFLEGELRDFKFFCFNGKPEFFYVAVTPGGDFHNNLLCDFFTMDGSVADFHRLDHKRFDTPPKIPGNINEMVDIAKKLSAPFPFVRVDLMNVDGKLYFSELTFTPSAGIMPLAPEGADEKLGGLLDISMYKR